MRSDLLLVHDPVERRGRSIGRVRRKTLALQAEAFLGAAVHRLRRADLRLTNGARGLDVDDHSELHIDEIVVGVGEKRRSSHRTGPLGSRVGRRYELRRHLAGSTEGRVIEGCQVLLHGAPLSLWITRLLAIRAVDRTLLAGVSYNQARIDRKPFTPDYPSRNTCLNNPLEDATEDVAVTEAFVAGPLDRRMIRDLVLDAQTAEPAVRQVDLNLPAEQPLRADGKNVANDEHPDHQHRVNRRAAER